MLCSRALIAFNFTEDWSKKQWWFPLEVDDHCSSIDDHLSIGCDITSAFNLPANQFCQNL
jgi:hypothetical protein